MCDCKNEKKAENQIEYRNKSQNGSKTLIYYSLYLHKSIFPSQMNIFNDNQKKKKKQDDKHTHSLLQQSR